MELPDCTVYINCTESPFVKPLPAGVNVSSVGLIVPLLSYPGKVVPCPLHTPSASAPLSRLVNNVYLVVESLHHTTLVIPVPALGTSPTFIVISEVTVLPDDVTVYLKIY